jgi:hypothetical protein
VPFSWTRSWRDNKQSQPVPAMTTVGVRASRQIYVYLILTALQELQSEFCPPLDASLVAAIALDFDLEEEQGAQEARFTLNSLKESAEEEENSGFDPSRS